MNRYSNSVSGTFSPSEYSPELRRAKESNHKAGSRGNCGEAPAETDTSSQPPLQTKEPLRTLFAFPERRVSFPVPRSSQQPTNTHTSPPYIPASSRDPSQSSLMAAPHSHTQHPSLAGFFHYVPPNAQSSPMPMPAQPQAPFYPPQSSRPSSTQPQPPIVYYDPHSMQPYYAYAQSAYPAAGASMTPPTPSLSHAGAPLSETWTQAHVNMPQYLQRPMGPSDARAGPSGGMGHQGMQARSVNKGSSANNDVRTASGSSTSTLLGPYAPGQADVKSESIAERGAVAMGASTSPLNSRDPRIRRAAQNLGAYVNMKSSSSPVPVPTPAAPPTPNSARVQSPVKREVAPVASNARKQRTSSSAGPPPASDGGKSRDSSDFVESAAPARFPRIPTRDAALHKRLLASLPDMVVPTADMLRTGLLPDITGVFVLGMGGRLPACKEIGVYHVEAIVSAIHALTFDLFESGRLQYLVRQPIPTLQGREAHVVKVALVQWLLPPQPSHGPRTARPSPDNVHLMLELLVRHFPDQDAFTTAVVDQMIAEMIVRVRALDEADSRKAAQETEPVGKSEGAQHVAGKAVEAGPSSPNKARAYSKVPAQTASSTSPFARPPSSIGYPPTPYLAESRGIKRGRDDSEPPSTVTNFSFPNTPPDQLLYAVRSPEIEARVAKKPRNSKLNPAPNKGARVAKNQR